MISLDTILHRIPELVIEVDSSNCVKIHHGGKVLRFEFDALSLLDVFQQAYSIREALGLLAPRLRGRRALEDTFTSIIKLRNAGILRDQSNPAFSALPFPHGGYDASNVHITILNDKVRKRAFLKAIREVVKPGDVVLDVGTGSGILAVEAARAGARHVYAVEPSAFINFAKEIISRNGVATQVTFIQGWLSQVELPEPATVLTTDIVGNEPLDMLIWETVQDARSRLLVAGARLVPRAVTAFAYLVSIPEAIISQYKVNANHVYEWKAAYDINFDTMLEMSEANVLSFYIKPIEAQDWEILSEPVLIYHVDFTADSSQFDVIRTVTANRPGLANGYIVFFTAELGPTTVLSTAPWQGSPDSHWFCAAWALPTTVPVQVGDILKFRYSYAGDGRSQLQPVDEPHQSLGKEDSL